MTATYLLNTRQCQCHGIGEIECECREKTMKLRRLVNVWGMVWDLLNMKIVLEPFWQDRLHDTFSDIILSEALGSVKSVNLLRFMNCKNLLEFCISNGFVQSAEILAFQDTTLTSDEACFYYRQRNGDPFIEKTSDSRKTSMQKGILYILKSTLKEKLQKCLSLVDICIRVGYEASDWAEIAVYVECFGEGDSLSQFIPFAIKRYATFANNNTITNSIWINRKQNVKYVIDAITSEDTELLDKLIESSYAVNNKEQFESSPLHVLCTNQDCNRYTTETCHKLSKAGADFFKKDKDGKLPLHIIAESADINLVEAIFACCGGVSRYNNTHKIWLDDYGRSPLFYAARFDELTRNKMFTLLYEKFSFRSSQEDVQHFTPYHQLASVGDFATAFHLELPSTLIRTVNSQGISLTAAAAEQCKKYFTVALVSNVFRIDLDRADNIQEEVRTKRSAYLNHPNDSGQTLMFISCKYGPHTEIQKYIQLLILMGASATLRDENEDNLLHAVASSQVRDRLCADKVRNATGQEMHHLLEYINDQHPGMVFAVNQQGKMPLHLASEHGMFSVVVSLITLAEDAFRSAPTIESMLLEDILTYVNKPDDDENTSLDITMLKCRGHMQAAYHSEELQTDLKNYVKIAGILLAAGAVVNRRTENITMELYRRYPSSKSVKTLFILLELSKEKPSVRMFGQFARMPKELFDKIGIQSKEPILRQLINDEFHNQRPKGLYFSEQEYDDRMYEMYQFSL